MNLGTVTALLAAAAAFTPDAFIRVDRRASQPVTRPVDAAEGCSLGEYMALPVEQYCSIELPLQASLTLASEVWPARSGASEFALRVPPLRFAIPGIPIVVEPLVYATVDTLPDSVLISSDECTLSGSAFVESLRLNERFTFRVRTRLTWAAGEQPIAMHADTHIEADVETPSLFALVPRRLLEGIAASAMALVLQPLQRTFLRNLVADYTRWATDAGYREGRNVMR